MAKEQEIERYCELKEQEKALSKDIKGLGSDIKEFLMDTDERSQQVGKWIVKLQRKVTEDVDTEKLLDVLTKYWDTVGDGRDNPFLSFVPVVNMEALEKALYMDELPADLITQIDGCRVKKESDALVYSRVKEGK